MVSQQRYGEDHVSGWSFGLRHVLLAIPAGSEDALRGSSLRILGMAEVAKPPALAAHPAEHDVPVDWDTSLLPGQRRCSAGAPVGDRLELIQRDEEVPTW